MSQSHQEYLLKKYLSGPQDESQGKVKRYRKRDPQSKPGESGSKKKRNTVLIDEDNDSTWNRQPFEDEEGS